MISAIWHQKLSLSTFNEFWLYFHCFKALKAILLTFATSKAYEIVYHHDKHFTDRVRNWFFQFVRTLPVIGDKIQAQVDEAKSSVLVLQADI